jgi:hypothetical protein
VTCALKKEDVWCARQLVKLESENSLLKREMAQQRQQMALMADNLAYLQKRQVRACNGVMV